MNSTESKSKERLRHPAICFVVVFGAVFTLTAAAAFLRSHVLSDSAAAGTATQASTDTIADDQANTSAGGKSAYTDGGAEHISDAGTDISPDNTKICFIRQLNETGGENFSLNEKTDDNGVKTYEYQLNKSVQELAADGSILFTDSNIVSAQTISTPNFNGEEEYSVSLELSDSDATAAIDAAIALLDTSESVGIYCNQQLYTVEPVTDLFGDGALMIPGFADRASAEDFIKDLCISGHSDV